MTAPATDKQRAFQRDALPHAEFLYNYALRMTNKAADAEHLVQETFLRAYRFWEGFTQGTNIRAWLFGIMKSVSFDRYRKDVREADVVEDNEHTGAPAKDDAEPRDSDGAIFGNLIDDEIQSAVASLSAEFRTVVILCDIEGLTYEEAADFLECPLDTVRSRLHLGRILLRDALESYARSRGMVSDK